MLNDRFLSERIRFFAEKPERVWKYYHSALYCSAIYIIWEDRLFYLHTNHINRYPAITAARVNGIPIFIKSLNETS